MISAWELYLFTRLDSLNVLLMIISIISVAVSIICGIVYAVEQENNMKKALIRYVLPLTLTASLLCVLVPTQKEAALIWITPQLATIENAELLKGEAAEIYKLAKQALTESLDINETQETK